MAKLSLGVWAKRRASRDLLTRIGEKTEEDRAFPDLLFARAAKVIVHGYACSGKLPNCRMSFSPSRSKLQAPVAELFGQGYPSMMI